MPIAAILFSALGSMGAQADVTTTSGSAYGISAVLLNNSLIPPTPSVSGASPPVNYPLATLSTLSLGLPSTANCPVTALNVPIGNIVEVCAITASTFGQGNADPHLNSANSNVSIAGAAIGSGPTGLLTLSAVNVACVADGNDATGAASLVLSGLGIAPLINGPVGPNTVIAIPGIAEVVLNEQYDRIHTAPSGVTPGTNSLKVNAVRITLLDNTEVILGHVECTATGPDVNAVPTTTSTSTSTSTSTTSTTQPGNPTTTSTSTTSTSSTSTSSTSTSSTSSTSSTVPTTASSTTSTTAATTSTTLPTTTTSTTVAVTVPPAGTTVPVATTTTTTRPPTVAPLARTGSNLVPLVGLGLLAIALGTLVRRSEQSFSPVTYADPAPTEPPLPPEFRPIASLPSAIRRRGKRNPLDPAVTDALTAFDGQEPEGEQQE